MKFKKIKKKILGRSPKEIEEKSNLEKEKQIKKSKNNVKVQKD